LTLKELKLDLNFDRLKTYFPNITEEQKAAIKLRGGYWFNFEWEYEDSRYIRIYNQLFTILEGYDLQEHINELYFILITLDDDFMAIKDLLDQDYLDTQTSKEVAQFLLTFKSAKPNQTFSLVAKSITNTASIKDERIAKWMCQLIYGAIEAQKFPFDIFGEKIQLHLFGQDFHDKPLTVENLETASKLNPRKPTYKKYLAKICTHLRAYLNEYTNLTTPDGVLLANTHATLFFDMFELFGYVDRMKITSEPKDYIHALLRNYLK
jgi:hypothetical protein